MRFPIKSIVQHSLFSTRIKLGVLFKVGLLNLYKAKKVRFCAFPYTPSIHKFPLLSNGYAIEKILHSCNVSVSQFNQWDNFDVILNWQDATIDTVDIVELINHSHEHSGRNISEKTVLINAQLHDISKKKMAEINKKIFGYDLDVDPTNYKGIAVKKSNKNAVHDGTIINCPIQKDEVKSECVYNVCINNVDKNNMVTDFRLIYMNGVLDYFYEKKRPENNRFSNLNSSVTLRKTTSEFSKTELALINHFCENLNVTYGEMDVLRDKNTNKIYIVDFAKTPFGPPNGLSVVDKIRAIQIMSVKFIMDVIVI